VDEGACLTQPSIRLICREWKNRLVRVALFGVSAVVEPAGLGEVRVSVLAWLQDMRGAEKQLAQAFAAAELRTVLTHVEVEQHAYQLKTAEPGLTSSAPVFARWRAARASPAVGWD